MTNKLPVVFRIDTNARTGEAVGYDQAMATVGSLLTNKGSRSFTVHRIETPTCDATLFLGLHEGYELTCEREKQHGGGHRTTYENNLISWDVYTRDASF